MKLVLSTLLVAVSAPALAAVGSTASLTDLHYELVDLDPNDGITPYVRFSGGALAQSFIDYHFCDVGNGCDRAMGSFTVPASAFVEDPSDGKSGFSSVSSAGLLAGGTFDISVNGYADTKHNEYQSRALYRTVDGQPLFVLSANTAIRVTGQYTLDAWGTPWVDARRGFGNDGSYASVFFQSKFIDGDPFKQEVSAFVTPTSPPDTEHLMGQMSVLLRNDKDHQAVLWGKWGVVAGGRVAGIPEPSTYALMLAGLAVVGVAARRRRT
ncbi:PEP-CTERM sorting domain-containing protein [Azohydromonas australica]|uniref:PEP-CTERM sorting domain-containing protein n=1 Tax=Azohydromonas australica TaxID=364039 RepID=UPI00048C7862|nr:PEP-CTERM sorting domain-containing protein [Azohydromonas australica]